MMQTRVGIIGGSFNPIHNAHLSIAEFILNKISLDKLIFLPSSRSPLKLNQTDYADIEHRCKMVELVIEKNPKFGISYLEADPNTVNYSYKTVEKLSKELKLDREQLFFIIGEDNYHNFDKWINTDIIENYCTVVVAKRQMDNSESYVTQSPIISESKSNIILEDSPLINISSSMIRAKIKDGKSIQNFVPNVVDNYILEHKLYLE